jgi:hypothetical protein
MRDLILKAEFVFLLTVAVAGLLASFYTLISD